MMLYTHTVISIGWKPLLNADSTSGKPFSNSDIIFETDSIHSADGSKSMQGSHVRETTYASPSEEFSENHFTRGSAGGGETLRFLSACLSNVTFPCLPKLCLFPQHGQTVI